MSISLTSSSPWPDLAGLAARLFRAALAPLRRPDRGAAGRSGRRAAPSRPPGTVFLVGAGPGDPELLTVAAVRALGRADVVLYDDLVGAGILDLARPGARLVHVGKRAGHHSHRQEEINALLAGHALAGRQVVRLKGGDPMLFGRAGEEIDHLRAAGVPVRVIPGVTAALGCAASAGLSLTRRGVARRVTFVTAHTRAGDEDAIDWHRLADPEATLVVYMGRDRLGHIAAALMEGGLPGDTPVLLVENGTRPDERRIAATLASLGRAAAGIGGGPALLMVGRATAGAACVEDHRIMLSETGTDEATAL